MRRRSSSWAVIRRRLSARFSRRASSSAPGERVEAIGDGGEFQHLRTGKAQPEITTLKGQRDRCRARSADRARGRARDRGSPIKASTVTPATAASATLFSQASAISSRGSLTISTVPMRRAVHGDRNLVALDRRTDQGRKPRRRVGAAAIARAAMAQRRAAGNCNAGTTADTLGVLAGRAPDADAHVTDETELRRQPAEKLLRRHPLRDQLHGFARHHLGEPHRGRDLDAGGDAGLVDDDGTADKARNKIDRDEHNENLGANRATEPQAIAETAPPPRGRSVFLQRSAGLAEHPFGTLKCRAGYREFLVQGFDKVASNGA